MDVLLNPFGNDFQRSICQRFSASSDWRGRPGVDLVRRCQDDGHRLGVNGPNFDVRLCRQKRKNVVGGLTFPDLADGRPVCPESSKAGERPGLIKCKPNVAALGFVKLAERIERHNAAMFDAEPSRSVFALDVTNVGRAAVGLHTQQLLEVDRFAFGFEFCGSLFRRFHQRML